jgi:hypothetical protein
MSVLERKGRERCESGKRRKVLEQGMGRGGASRGRRKWKEVLPKGDRGEKFCAGRLELYLRPKGGSVLHLRRRAFPTR